MTLPVSKHWYFAYGSNLQTDLLGRYIDDPAGRESRWFEVPHALYFGGHSLRWNGPVAFLSLRSHASRTWSRAYAVGEGELEQICRGENGVETSVGSALDALGVGEWAEVDGEWTDDPQLGKYNAVLRGPDIDGGSSFTFTTGRTLPLGTPPTPYVDAIRTGLRDRLSAEEANGYLTSRREGLNGDNTRFLTT